MKAFLQRHAALFMGLFLTLAVVLSLRGFAQIGHRIRFEASGPMNEDSAVYLAVGRGLLNGIKPYTGLYDIKPPGIFLLSALSLKISGDNKPVATFELMAFFVVFLSIVVPVFMYARRKICSPWCVPAAFFFGALLTTYASIRSGRFQVESFGAAFACAYVSLVAVKGKKPFGIGMSLLCAVLVFLSVFFKEPFALALLASAIILIPERKLLLKNAVLPAIVALALFFVSLLLLGALGGYLDIYLREMLGFHIGAKGSITERMLDFFRLYKSLDAFSFPLALIVFLLPASLCLDAIKTKDGALRILVLAFACVLTMTAVAAGGNFYGHHFVFAIPFYVALFFALCRAEFLSGRVKTFVLLIITTLGVFGVASLPNNKYVNERNALERDQARMKNEASAIDSILDACGVERYLYIGKNGFRPYAFTRHSPIGPLFHQYDYFFDGKRPRYTDWFRDQLAEARVIFWGQTWNIGKINAETQGFVADNFALQPWPCAQDIVVPESLVVVFHKDGPSALKHPEIR